MVESTTVLVVVYSDAVYFEESTRWRGIQPMAVVVGFIVCWVLS